MTVWQKGISAQAAGALCFGAQGFPPFTTAGPYFLFVTCSLLKTLMLLRGFRKKVGKKLAAYSDATAVVPPTASRDRMRRHGRGTVSGC